MARRSAGDGRLPRTRWSWSSKTNRSFGGAAWACSAGSYNSSVLTSKNRPYTSFMASSAAAMPPEPDRNCRRLMPSLWLASSARSSTRASTRFCSSVWGAGMYSPLEIIRVGTGERRGSATSARSHLATCSTSSSPWSSSQTRPASFHSSTGMCYLLLRCAIPETTGGSGTPSGTPVSHSTAGSTRAQYPSHHGGTPGSLRPRAADDRRRDPPPVRVRPRPTGSRHGPLAPLPLEVPVEEVQDGPVALDLVLLLGEPVPLVVEDDVLDRHAVRLHRRDDVV